MTSPVPEREIRIGIDGFVHRVMITVNDVYESTVQDVRTVSTCLCRKDNEFVRDFVSDARASLS
jgi:hypothetical protein